MAQDAFEAIGAAMKDSPATPTVIPPTAAPPGAATPITQPHQEFYPIDTSLLGARIGQAMAHTTPSAASAAAGGAAGDVGVDNPTTQGPSVAPALNGDAPQLSGATMYTGVPATYQSAFQSAATQHGVPADILGRVAYDESHFRDDIISGQVKSSTGATGMFQFMPATAKDRGIADPNDPKQAINGGAEYLHDLHSEFKDWRQAVAAYNWGPGNVRKDIEVNGADWEQHLPSETVKYLATIFPTKQ